MTRSRLTLRQQLVLLLAFLSLGVLFVMGTWGYVQTRRLATEAVIRNVRNVAALEAAQTRDFVESKRNLVLSIVAGNQHLFGTLRAMHETTDPVTLAALEQSLRAHLAAKTVESEATEELFVVSESGRLLASSRSDRFSGADLAPTPFFRNGRAAPSTVHVEPIADRPTLMVAVPVRDDANMDLGVFCAHFRFEVARDYIEARKHRTTDAMLYLLDEASVVLASAFDDPADAPLGKNLPSFGRPATGRAPWDSRYVAWDGEPVIAAYAPIPELHWGMLVEVPVARAFASIERLKWQGVAFGFVLAVVLALVSRRAVFSVTRPLGRLSEAARRASSGHLGEPVAVDGPAEIADLAGAFNEMSVALKDSHDLLERRISDRTEALQKSQNFTELLLDSLDQFVVVIDRSFRIVKANRAAKRMYGDLPGLFCHASFEGRAEPCGQCPVSQCFITGRAVSSERPHRTSAGQDIVRVEAFPLVSPSGEVEAAVYVGRIVTDEKRLLAQMVHQEKMVAFGLVAAGMAHEIGNPLAALQSQLRLARDDESPERTRQTLQIVERYVERISKLLRDLATFARRKRDEVILVSLNQVVEDVVHLLSHDPRARGVEIRGVPADDLPGVRATEDSLTQVLLNLGLNALDAMPQGGTLVFETTASDGHCVVRVRDTGNGVPSDARGRLFEPFFTTKAPGRGTGLGLFVSKGIVDGLGGRLDLESSGPEGSVFTVCVPAAQPPALEARS